MRPYNLPHNADHTSDCAAVRHQANSRDFLVLTLCDSMSKIDALIRARGEYRGRTDDLLHAMQAL